MGFTVVFVAVASGVLVISGLLVIRLAIHDLSPELRAGHAVFRCDRCGFSMSGLPADGCPGCGKRLEASRHEALPSPRLRRGVLLMCIGCALVVSPCVAVVLMAL